MNQRMEEPLGLPRGTVVVVPYNPVWPRLYAQEAARLHHAARTAGLRLPIEHTGSTAVPGLAAKPVIDILVGYASQTERAIAREVFQSVGYAWRGEQEIPGRDFFRRGEPRQYHLHLAGIDSDFWREHLTFRDFLREHADVAQAYAALKITLANKFPRDREAYIRGKTSFVHSVLARANTPHRDVAVGTPDERREDGG